MLAPQEVSVYLNNALKAKPVLAEVNSDTPLPEAIRDMPDQVSGHFIELDEPTASELATAVKRTMILNQTQVLYTFTFDPSTGNFTARKR